MLGLKTKVIGFALTLMALPADATAAELVFDFSVSPLSTFTFEKPGLNFDEVTSVTVAGFSSLGTPTIRCTCFPSINTLVFGSETFVGSGLVNFIGSGTATVGSSGILGAPLEFRNPGFTGRITFNLAGTAAAAVPEPATWAMLLVGFGATGMAMRAKRRVPAAA